MHAHEGYGPHVIPVRDAKVVAVPANRWKGGPVNPYGSGSLPAYSRDGRYVILGKQVNHPGFPGVKYPENPFNRLKAKVLRVVRFKVKKALKDEK
ncbi:MAG TPA: hypothetical protein GXX23_09365 [Firmicutes bacterium]|nr:hypothetical protein [Candidatus Fermentithermobacillaceae bacterium]